MAGLAVSKIQASKKRNRPTDMEVDGLNKYLQRRTTLPVVMIAEPRTRALKRPRDMNDTFDVILPPTKRQKMTRDWMSRIRRMSPRQLERMKERIIENKRKWYALQLARGRPPSNRMHAYLYGRAPKPQPRPTKSTGPVLSHPYSPPLHGSRKVKVVWRRNGKIVTGTEVKAVDRDVQTTAPVRADTSSQKRTHDNNMLPDYDETEYPAPSAKRQKPSVQKEEADTAPMKKRVLPKKNNARRIQIRRKYRNLKPAGDLNSAVTPWVPPKPADTPIGRFIDEQIKKIRASMTTTSTTTKPAPKHEHGNSEPKAGSKPSSDSSSDESDSESDTDSDTDSSGISSGESDGEDDDVSSRSVSVPLQILKSIPTVSKITPPTQAQPPVSGISTLKAATSEVFGEPALNGFRAPTSQKRFKVPCIPVRRLSFLFRSKLSLASSTVTTKPAVKQAGPDNNPFKLHLKNHNVLKRTFISHQYARMINRQTTFSFPPAYKCYFGTKGRFGQLYSAATTELDPLLSKLHAVKI